MARDKLRTNGTRGSSRPLCYSWQVAELTGRKNVLVRIGLDCRAALTLVKHLGLGITCTPRVTLAKVLNLVRQG